MKKTLLLAALLTASAGAAQAQITLTAATHMPKADTFFSVSFSDTSTTYTLPASGANVTWNYAGVLAGSQDTTSYFNCVPQANCASFGSIDLLSGSAANNYFEYYKTGNNVFQIVGTKDPSSQFQLTDPYDLYRFPFTYNTRYVETYSGTATLQGSPVSITLVGRDSVSGAGYGTLITPAGTFQNALMIRSARTGIINLPGQGTDTSYSYQFEWFVANSRYSVMKLFFNVEKAPNGQWQLTGSGGTYRSGGPLSITPTPATDVADRLRIVPNPTAGMARVEIPITFQSAQATVLVTDLTGKTVYQQALTGQEAVSLNTSNWAKGVYLVQLQNAGGARLVSRLSVL